jgi:hypothetical protein
MTELDELSHMQKHALWVSCMASNVPVPLDDSRTIDRVSGLLRSPVADAGHRNALAAEGGGSEGPLRGGSSAAPDLEEGST